MSLFRSVREIRGIPRRVYKVMDLEDQDRFDVLIDVVRKAAADDLSLQVDRGMAPLSIAWGGRGGEVYSIVNDLDAFRTLPTSAMVERVMARIRAWQEDPDR